MSSSTASGTTGQRIALALAFAAMFVAVVLLAGREPGADVPTASSEEPTRTAAPVLPAAASTSTRAASANASSTAPDEASADTALAATAAPPVPDRAEIADLSRQVMPLDETTAEENERRGDAIRRLSATPTADAAQPLIYALRNDVDIRNRILAIDGLRRAALAGNPDRAIIDALSAATRSDDEVIASQARSALAEIERARPR